MVGWSNPLASYGVNTRSFRVGSETYGRDVECRLLVLHRGHIASACMDAEIRCVRCRVVFSSTDVVIGLESSVTPDIASGNRKLEIPHGRLRRLPGTDRISLGRSPFSVRCNRLERICHQQK